MEPKASNPWILEAQRQPWPGERTGALATASPSLWQAHKNLLKERLLSDLDLDLSGLISQDLRTDRGGVSIVVDDDAQFLSLRRWHVEGDLSDGISMVEIEAFWCPVSPSAARCGYRLTALGDPSRIGYQWTDEWAGFALRENLDANDRQSWDSLPGHANLVCAWAGQTELCSAPSQESQPESRLDELQAELASMTQLADEQAARADRLERELAQWRAASGKESPWAVASSANGPQSASTEDLAWSNFDDLECWAERNADHVTILPRAINAAKKSDYIAPDHVRRGLEFLAGPYRQARLGKLSKEGLDRALSLTGMKLSGSVGVSVAGEQGSAYFVHWNNKRQLMDMHLVKGGGRETRYCCRIYFFWCQESQRAVVGWLPSHLSNSLS